MPGLPPSNTGHKKNVTPLFKHRNKQKGLDLIWAKYILFFAGILVVCFYLAKIWVVSPKTAEDHPLISIKASLSAFVGRFEYLDALEKEKEFWDKNNRFRQAALVKVLWGKPGYGKSELATEFANRHFSKFCLLWTFNCDSQEHINQGYRQLSEELGIYQAHESNEKIQQKVHFYLENQLKKPWLLIYDNVEEAIIDMPQRGGMILITSQKKILNPKFWIEIKPFSREETLLLFEKVTHKKRDSAMQKLADNLEDIPLLVNCVSHHINAMPGCTFDEYERLFASHLLENQNMVWKEGDLQNRYYKNFLASWEFPLRSLERESPQAYRWLSICGYLHPMYIREEWIDEWLKQTKSEKELILQYTSNGHLEGAVKQNSSEANDQNSSEKLLQNALFNERAQILRELQRYGIIQYDEKAKVFSLHRLFQYVIRESRKSQLQDDLKQAIALLRKYALSYHLKNMSSWKEGEQWYLSACEVEKWIERFYLELKQEAFKADQALLYEGIAEWCIFNDRNQEGLKANYRVLELRKEVFGENSVEVGKTYELLGWSLYKLNCFNEALEAISRAEKIEQEVLGPQSPDYALTLATKGMVFSAQGKYRKALELHEKALKIRLNSYGEDHIQVGRSFYHISVCLRKMGRFAEAKIQNDRAIAVYLKTCGKEHPWYNWCLHNQGWIFFDSLQYEQALELFQQALYSHIALKGKDQLAVGYCWNGIGWCHLRMGNLKQAKKSFRRGLHNSKKNLKGGQRSLAGAHKGLGLTYIQKGNRERSKKHFAAYQQICSVVYKDTPRLDRIRSEIDKDE